MTQIVNKMDLRKIDSTKPHAFEMIRLQNNEIVCVAYITSSEQWKKFLKDYEGEKIYVSTVDVNANTAIMVVE